MKPGRSRPAWSQTHPPVADDPSKPISDLLLGEPSDKGDPMTEAIATREPQALAQRYELEVEDMIAQVQKIQQVMAKVMKPDEHYGVIPGTGTKPTLLKPGAEKLCLLFRLAPHYESTEEHDGKHVTIKSVCSLHHIPTGQVWGTGEGSCSTKESKYAYRKGARLCPKCGKDAIIKGKDEYGGGWVCFKKKDGCGAKFSDGDISIESQSTERVANEDLADSYNTVLKMANKRSLVAVVLNVTAASDIFTQDIEDAPPVRAVVVETTARRVDDAPVQPGGTASIPDGPINAEQITRLWSIARHHQWTEAQVKALLQRDSTKDIPRSEYEAVIERLKQGPGEKPA